jgi:hypothetical protein
MNTPLEDRIKASLEQSSTQLDTETLQRLQAARRSALSPAGKVTWFNIKTWFSLKNWFNLKGLLPTASLAFCTVIAILIAFPSNQTVSNSPPNNASDQTAMLELLDDPEDLDTLSDPDFYIWMEEIEANKKDNYAA